VTFSNEIMRCQRLADRADTCLPMECLLAWGIFDITFNDKQKTKVLSIGNQMGDYVFHVG